MEVRELFLSLVKKGVIKDTPDNFMTLTDEVYRLLADGEDVSAFLVSKKTLDHMPTRTKEYPTEDKDTKRVVTYVDIDTLKERATPITRNEIRGITSMTTTKEGTCHKGITTVMSLVEKFRRIRGD